MATNIYYPDAPPLPVTVLLPNGANVPGQARLRVMLDEIGRPQQYEATGTFPLEPEYLPLVFDSSPIPIGQLSDVTALKVRFEDGYCYRVNEELGAVAFVAFQPSPESVDQPVIVGV